jgi:hypothetical protein
MTHGLDCTRSAFVVHLFHSIDDPVPAVVPRSGLAEWAMEQFGYIPTGEVIQGRPHLIFRFAEDATLFRLHFAHLWGRE